MRIRTWPTRSPWSALRVSLLAMLLIVCLIYTAVILDLKYDKSLGNGFARMFESLNGNLFQIVMSVQPNRRLAAFRRVNLKSVGAPAKEDRLILFEHWVQEYDLSFGRLPQRPSDFAALAEDDSLRLSKTLIVNLSQQCRIFTFSGDSYLLNCDGAQSRDGEDVQRRIQQLDPGTERFYSSDGHIFLYAPPKITGN